MIRYELPDFTASLGLNLHFVRLISQRPWLAQSAVRVEALYGSFPGCALNGGRAYVRDAYTQERIAWTFSVMSEYGLIPRLTFTNMLADPAMLDDAYANRILEAAAQRHGEVIVYAECVADYVRSRFGMPLTLSTTVPLKTSDAVNRALDEYDAVVLDYDLHKDESFLAGIEHRERVEVMVNEFCMLHCPHREEHYLHNSRNQLESSLEPFPCSAVKPDFFKHESGHPTIFTDEEVATYSKSWGIERFKIVGRGTVFETQLESLAYYLVKPDYRSQVKAEVRRLMR